MLSFKKLFKKSVYLLLIALGPRCCAQAFSNCREWRLLSGCGVWASRGGGFPGCGAWTLGLTGFSSCCLWDG